MAGLLAHGSLCEGGLPGKTQWHDAFALTVYSCGGSLDSEPAWVVPIVFPINPERLNLSETIAVTIPPDHGNVNGRTRVSGAPAGASTIAARFP